MPDTFTLADQAQILTTAKLTAFDATQKWPDNVPHPHAVYIRTPSGLATIEHDYSYVPKAVVPPPPPGPTALIPAAFQSRLAAGQSLSIDPNGPMWDTGAGGSQVFGSMNGVSFLRSNVFSAADGTHVRVSSTTQGATMTTCPRNDPRNARKNTGAAQGFAFVSGLVQAKVAFAVDANGKALAWFAFWTDDMSANWPKDGEIDGEEAARWSGGNGVITANIHGTNQSPDWTEPISDGRPHTIGIMRTPGAAGSLVSIFVDGNPVEENYQTTDSNSAHMLILSAGYASGNPVPPLPADAVLSELDYFPLAA